MTAGPDNDDPEDDIDAARLFREAVRGVRPLGSRDAPPRPPKARPRARFTRADRAAVLRESLDGAAATRPSPAARSWCSAAPRSSRGCCADCAAASTASSARSTCTG